LPISIVFSKIFWLYGSRMLNETTPINPNTTARRLTPLRVAGSFASMRSIPPTNLSAISLMTFYQNKNTTPVPR